MKSKPISKKRCASLNLMVALGICLIATSPRMWAESTVYNTTLGETNPVTPEIETEQLKKILADRGGPVLDVRFAQECAIAHVPESVNVWEEEVGTGTQPC